MACCCLQTLMCSQMEGVAYLSIRILAVRRLGTAPTLKDLSIRCAAGWASILLQEQILGLRNGPLQLLCNSCAGFLQHCFCSCYSFCGLASHVSSSILSLHNHHHQMLTLHYDVSYISAPHIVAMLLTVRDKVCLAKQLMHQNS